MVPPQTVVVVRICVLARGEQVLPLPVQSRIFVFSINSLWQRDTVSIFGDISAQDAFDVNHLMFNM